MLAADDAQRLVAQRLDDLATALDGYRAQKQPTGLRAVFIKPKPAPKGLYVHGEVGRGKTMLMDLFFEVVRVETKRRVHFHAFMQDVHDRIHSHRQAVKAGSETGDDPIPPVAKAIAKQASLLCFDEFQVSDITDAMILGRLFEALFKRGVVIVATSNTEPSQLYRDGLNRSLFVPFIKLIEERLDVVSLDGDNDYRQRHAAGEDVYLSPLTDRTAARFETLWLRLSGGSHGESRVLRVKGRDVIVPHAVGRMARFSFADLCERPLGAGDYLAVAKAFDVVFLEAVPVLRHHQRNEATRFIKLIDAFYDQKIRLVISAEAEPDALYMRGDNASAFQRTASRLSEMRTDEYWANAQKSGSRTETEQSVELRVP